MEFKIPAMSCGHCASAITQAVKQIDPAAQVAVDLAAKQVNVQSTLDRNQLAAALADAGYPAA